MNEEKRTLIQYRLLQAKDSKEDIDEMFRKAENFLEIIEEYVIKKK